MADASAASSAPAPAPALVVVLVTGGSGLVGSAIAEVAPASWPGASFVFARSRDADLTDRTATFALFARVRPSHVVHCAARVGGLFKNMRSPVEMGRENALMNDNVMEACRAHACVLVSFLSTCIFPDRTAYPIDESMVHDGPPHPSNAAYAHAKRFSDVMSRAYRFEYGLKFSSVIPTNIYGLHDNFHLDDAHVVPALVHKALLAKRSGGALVVAGSGAPLRQFIFARDLARLTLLVLRERDAADPLILSVGAEDEISIRRVAELVAAATGLRADQLTFDASKADGQLRKTASNRRLLDFLADKAPGFAFTPIEQGIAETVRWFEQHFDEARK